MSKYNGSTPEQKAFLKRFGDLNGSRSRWQNWNDMITIFACAIANTCDKTHFEEREKLYLDTIGKYNDKQKEIFPELFVMLGNVMERDGNIDFKDFLGELFMLCEFGNDSGGQFFTPYTLSRLMSKTAISEDYVNREIENHGYLTMNDPSCGAGATLIAGAERLLELGINYQEHALFVAQDIDYGTALMCYVQLSLLGCPAVVHIGNTLSEPFTGSALMGSHDANTWCTPMWYSPVWTGRRLDRVVGRMIIKNESEKKVELKKPASAPEQISFSFDGGDKP